MQLYAVYATIESHGTLYRIYWWFTFWQVYHIIHIDIAYYAFSPTVVHVRESLRRDLGQVPGSEGFWGSGRPRRFQRFRISKIIPWFTEPAPKSCSKAPVPKPGFQNLVLKTLFHESPHPVPRSATWFAVRLIETYWNRVSRNTVFREPAPAAPWNSQHIRLRPEPSARGSSWTPKRFPPKAPTWAGERNPLEGNGFGWGREDVFQTFEMT